MDKTISDNTFSDSLAAIKLLVAILRLLTVKKSMAKCQVSFNDDVYNIVLIELSVMCSI